MARPLQILASASIWWRQNVEGESKEVEAAADEIASEFEALYSLNKDPKLGWWNTFYFLSCNGQYSGKDEFTLQFKRKWKELELHKISFPKFLFKKASNLHKIEYTQNKVPFT